jgi:REP element-mobilizing transposase RayT
MKKQMGFDFLSARKTFFGGSLLKDSHAKKARPLSTKNPIHLVLRSSQAKGEKSFLTLRNQKIVKDVLKKTARKFHIQVLEFSNVGNHLHLLIRGFNRTEIKNFLRTFSALVARYCQDRHKGSGQGKSFWDQRPFTRIVESFRGYLVAKDYVIQNHLEAMGIIPYKLRKHKPLTG